MAYTLKSNVVRREENLHYVEWEGQENAVLAGTGITDWTDDTSISTDDGQYINEKNEHSNALSYSPKISYTGELIPSDPFVMHLYQVGKKQLLGEMFTEFEVETWAAVNESTGEYAAHKRTYEIQPSKSGSGAGGEKIGLEGTFAQKGDTLHGKFNITTKQFTEGTFDYTTGEFTSSEEQAVMSKVSAQKNTN